jgi:hypothetical protein
MEYASDDFGNFVLQAYLNRTRDVGNLGEAFQELRPHVQVGRRQDVMMLI